MGKGKAFSVRIIELGCSYERCDHILHSLLSGVYDVGALAEGRRAQSTEKYQSTTGQKLGQNPGPELGSTRL